MKAIVARHVSMWSRSYRAGVSALLCLSLSQAAVVSAQARFETLTHDALPAVPGLQVVTVRDNMLNACYIVFVMDPAPRIGTVGRVDPPDVPGAAAALDQRLDDLSASFEHWRSEVPGTMSPNPLRYQWEAAKAQHAFDLTVFEAALGRLEERLDRLTEGPRVSAALSPGPCVPASARKQP